MSRRLAAQRFFACVVCVVIGSASASNEAGKAFLAENGGKPEVTTLPSGLQYRVLASGPLEGKSPQAGSPCVCHYTGTLIDGTVFDSSVKRGKPATFAPNQVIKGWTQALQMMKPGDKWLLTIPSELAYGDRGSPPRIPGGSVLLFELELLEVKEASPWTLFGWDFSDPQTLLFAAIGLYFLYKTFGGGGGGSAGPRLALETVSSAENPVVYFDMQVGDEAVGRIEMELFKAHYPRTADNFRALCTGEKGVGKSGKPLHYANSSFHRVIPGFMCQGGDFTRGNGTGGESIYGETFEDEFESGYVGHSEPYLLSMANAGPHSNGSQFFLTTARTPHLDGKHVVFGKVVSGKEVVDRIEAVGSSSGRTSQPVIVAASGEVEVITTSPDMGKPKFS